MAMNIQPVDGLINRLLQQNSKPSSPARPASSSAPARQDQVSISSTAQKQQAASTESYLPLQSSDQSSSKSQHQLQNKPSERALESHLLNLYKKNDSFGG